MYPVNWPSATCVAASILYLHMKTIYSVATEKNYMASSFHFRFLGLVSLLNIDTVYIYLQLASDLSSTVDVHEIQHFLLMFHFKSPPGNGMIFFLLAAGMLLM